MDKLDDYGEWKDAVIQERVDYLKPLLKTAMNEQYVGEQAPYPAGLKVAIEQKLAPVEIQLTIEREVEDDHRLLKMADRPKYHFHYQYLDLPFTIRTNDDKVATQLFPFFTEEQKTRLMAMTLGNKGDK